jgi:hypothetical protein
MGSANIICPEIKCCVEKSNTINLDNLKVNSVELDNLKNSRILIPFRIDSIQHSIFSDQKEKNLNEILPNDSLNSIQYYSNFDNDNSSISSIKSSLKDSIRGSNYIPTLFKNSSLQNNEIYFREDLNNSYNYNNNQSKDLSIEEEDSKINDFENHFENVDSLSLCESKVKKAKLKNHNKNQKDF